MPTTKPALKHLADAILSNSTVNVKLLLAAGGNDFDVNQLLDKTSIPLLNDFYKTKDGAYLMPPHIKVALGTDDGFVTLLHLAMTNMYHSLQGSYNRDDHPHRLASMEIVNLLLDHGASVDQPCSTSVVVTNMWHTYLDEFTPTEATTEGSGETLTALDLLEFYDTHPKFTVQEEHPSVICTKKELKDLLTKGSTNKQPSKLLTTKETTETPKSSPVPTNKKSNETLRIVKETTEILKSLWLVLSSRKFNSDMTIACSDGEKIVVNRARLAAASPEFAPTLTGAFKNDAIKVLHTKYPSSVIQRILDIVHTGRVVSDPRSIFANVGEMLEVLEVATDFGMTPIANFATHACIASLDASNVHKVLRYADKRDVLHLQKACWSFLRTNSTRNLLQHHPDVLALTPENPPGHRTTSRQGTSAIVAKTLMAGTAKGGPTLDSAPVVDETEKNHAEASSTFSDTFWQLWKAATAFFVFELVQKGSNCAAKGETCPVLDENEKAAQVLINTYCIQYHDRKWAMALGLGLGNAAFDNCGLPN